MVIYNVPICVLMQAHTSSGDISALGCFQMARLKEAKSYKTGVFITPDQSKALVVY